MKYLIFALLVVFSIYPIISLAQSDIADKPTVQKLQNLLDDIAMLLFIIGAGVALIIVIASGIQYMIAGGDEAKVAAAKKTLTYGLIGTAIILCSGFIINLLEDILADIAY